MTSPTFAYAGCFSGNKASGHGKGISAFRIDPSTGTWTLVAVMDTLPSPGFLALDRQYRYLYSAHGDGEEISAYTIDAASGKLQLLNRQASGGKNGVHLDIDPSNRHVALAHGSGVVTIFPLNPDGTLAPYSDRSHCEGAFHHQVVFDASGRFVVAPNHATNKIHVFQFDAARGKFTRTLTPLDCPAGPRHLVFHPSLPFLYDINKNSTINSYAWNAQTGALRPFQVTSTVPDTFKGASGGCEIAIAPSGKFLYASNRGHDSIAIFAIDQTSGMLKAASWEATQGKLPRHFALDPAGAYLHVGNLESDSIVVFKVNGDTGKLTPTGQVVNVASPTCIAFACRS
jgi:6-phosphogluconolactonase